MAQSSRDSTSLAAGAPDAAAASAVADAKLVARVRAGDSAAFELLMRRYNQRLFRLARSILKDAPEAEDVVQEAYVRAYEKLDSFIGPDGFAAWLSKIALNEALGRLRCQGRVVPLEARPAGGDGGAETARIETMKTDLPDPERLAASSELRRILESAIDTLPDEFRATFMLRAVEGMSVAETACLLSIPEGTVKTRFHRARMALQDSLGAQFDALMPSVFTFAGRNCDCIVAAVLARLAPALQAARQAAAAVKAPPDGGRHFNP